VEHLKGAASRRIDGDSGGREGVKNEVDQNPSEPKSSAALILAGASIVTVVWLGAAALLLLSSQRCSWVPTNPWADHIACLTANEIGDTLAGAFAPLALIWLIATVLLQSQELRAQRYELRLTRLEMTASRGVLSAQREEAQRSADLMAGQLEVLQQQRSQDRQEATDRNTEAMLMVTFKAMIQAFPIIIVRPGAEERLFAKVTTGDLADNLTTMTKHSIGVADAAIQAVANNQQVSLKNYDQQALEEVMIGLGNIEEDFDNCSPAMQMRIIGCNVQTLHDRFLELAKSLELTLNT
jgi:hypothetical protein